MLGVRLTETLSVYIEQADLKYYMLQNTLDATTTHILVEIRQGTTLTYTEIKSSLQFSNLQYAIAFCQFFIRIF